MTTAAHVIITHMVQFCKFKGKGLGKFSEQASESVHAYFCEAWEKSGKISRNNNRYDHNLLTAVVRYNGRHIGV